MQSILLVEDSKLSRMATERVLTRAGYQVTCVGDGEQAWAVANSRVPDLIILDMLLPKLSGQELLRSLKNNPHTAGIPVLVLSSLSEKNQERLLREGAVAFLTKAALLENPQLLLSVVRTILVTRDLAEARDAAGELAPAREGQSRES